MEQKRLLRSNDRVLGGVCGGIYDQYHACQIRLSVII